MVQIKLCVIQQFTGGGVGYQGVWDGSVCWVLCEMKGEPSFAGEGLVACQPRAADGFARLLMGVPVAPMVKKPARRCEDFVASDNGAMECYDITVISSVQT